MFYDDDAATSYSKRSRRSKMSDGSRDKSRSVSRLSMSSMSSRKGNELRIQLSDLQREQIDLRKLNDKAERKLAQAQHMLLVTTNDIDVEVQNSQRIEQIAEAELLRDRNILAERQAEWFQINSDINKLRQSYLNCCMTVTSNFIPKETDGVIIKLSDISNSLPKKRKSIPLPQMIIPSELVELRNYISQLESDINILESGTDVPMRPYPSSKSTSL